MLKLNSLLKELSYCDFVNNQIIPKVSQLNNIKNFNQLEKIISQNYLDFLVYEYIKREKNTFIITVWPVCLGGDDIIRNHYSKNCNVIYYKEIKLNPNGYKNFLHYISDKKTHKSGIDLWFAKPYSDKNKLRIYVIKTNPESLNNTISDMKEYLVTIFNNNEAHINKLNKQELKNLYITTRNKKKCRLALHRARKIPRVLKETPPYQYSHHVNDFHRESIDIGKIVLNNNTLNLIQYFKWGKLKGFNQKFKSFRKFLSRNKINTDKIIIYNSGVLGPLGLREPSDIDFLQLDKNLIRQKNLPPDIDIQNKYFQRGYMILQTRYKAQYMEDNPRFLEKIPLNSLEIIWKLSINDIVFNPNYYFYYDGIKFMDVDLFKKVKRIRGRSKDLEQVKLLEKNITKIKQIIPKPIEYEEKLVRIGRKMMIVKVQKKNIL